MIETPLTATLAVLFSENVLSLYPILIKRVPTTLFTQTLARFLIFPLMALLVVGPEDLVKVWSTPADAVLTLLHGALNLAHVAMSYYAFKKLTVGTAVSLFYTYPLFSLAASALVFGDRVEWADLVWMVVGIVGAYLVATSRTANTEGFAAAGTAGAETSGPVRIPVGVKQVQKATEPPFYQRIPFRPILAILGAAVSEALIYVFARLHGKESPYYMVNHLYSGGAVLLLLYMAGAGRAVGLQAPKADLRLSTWVPLFVFNAFAGFIGYLLRFYSIPRLPSVVFNTLSFVGVLAAFMWGAVFMDEKPGLTSIIGGGMIAAAAAGVIRRH